MHPTTTTAVFHGQTVTLIHHAGRRWLTAEQIGLCLGYAHNKARISISNLYNRHADEFTPEDTGVIKLMTNPQGGNPTTRIFSHTGCIKLGFFAATAKAKAFRAWAAQTLAGGMPAPVAPVSSLLPTPKVTRDVELKALTLFADGHSYREIAEALGISASTVGRLTRGTYRFAFNAGVDLTTPELLRRVAQRHIARDIEMLTQKYCASQSNKRLEQTLDEAGQRFLGGWQAALEGPEGGGQ
jgi:transcriptional regulator with XRE-family HTH domain